MTSSEISNLLKVSELRKAIKNQFTAKKLQEQGLQRDLTQLYKPWTESQAKNTADIITHLSNLSNQSNKKLIDFKDTFKNFPDLIASIDQVKSLLDIKTTEIINKIKTREPDVADDIEQLDRETREFEDALSEIASDADTGIVTDQSFGAVSKQSLPGVKKAKEYVEKQAQLKKSLESQADTSYNYTLAASELTEWKKSLSNILSDENLKHDLLKYVDMYPASVNLRNNPWRRIGNVDAAFFDQLKNAKQSHARTGRGIQFLPDNKKDLVTELFRLLGSYKSGNKNVFNELNAVVDQLRRKGVLTIDQSKKFTKQFPN